MENLRECIRNILYGWLIISCSFLPVLILILEGVVLEGPEIIIIWLLTIITVCVLQINCHLLFRDGEK